MTPQEKIAFRFAGALVGCASLLVTASVACGQEQTLDSFYFRIDHPEQGKNRPLRITQIGDSLTAADDLPAATRDRLQRYFGDGGAGFIHAGEPTRWLQRQSGARRLTHGMKALSVVGALPAHRRLGPAAALFADEGGTLQLETASHGAGASASRFTVHYLTQPRGGRLRLSIDGVLAPGITTASREVTPQAISLETTDGPHRFAITTDKGEVLLAGVSLERDVGLVYDNFGLVSNSAFTLARMDLGEWQQALSLLGPDLVVVFLGANDLDQLVENSRAMTRYAGVYARVLSSARGPERRSCLVMTALDPRARPGYRRALGELYQRLLEAQRSAAEEAGCVSFDPNSVVGDVVRARREGLLSRDGIHLTAKGARRLGGALGDLLLEGYRRYRGSAARADASGSQN